MKRILLTCVGVATLIFLFAFSKSSNEPSFVHVFQVDGQAELELATSGGSIEVKQGKSDEVMLEFIVRKKGKIMDMTLEDLKMEKEVAINQSDNNVKVKVANKKGVNKSNISVSLVAYVPNKTSSNLRTSGGHLSVSGLIGSQHLKTSGGHIEMADIKGNIDSKTSGGMIKGKDLMGIVKVSTSGGHISMNHLQGILEARTSGGNISLERISGSASAQTSGGNISVDFVEMDGNGSFKTSGGNVSVNVPDDQGLNVQLRGSYVDMKLSAFSGDRQKREVEGTVNGGGYALTCQTSGGKVSLY